MATANPIPDTHGEDNFILELERVKERIKHKFEEIIKHVKKREIKLLEELELIQISYNKYKNELETQVIRTKSLKETMKYLEEQKLKIPVHGFHDNLLKQTEEELKSVKFPTEPKMVRFVCQNEQLLEELNRLGKVLPIVSVCDKEKGMNQLYPWGVEFNNRAGKIYPESACNVVNPKDRKINQEITPPIKESFPRPPCPRRIPGTSKDCFILGELYVPPLLKVQSDLITLNAPKEPSKPKFKIDMSPVWQDISPRGPGQQNHSLPSNFSDGSYITVPPRQDFTQKERTILILDQVPPPVNDETMCQYFKDYLEHTWTWDSTPVGENLYRVAIEFSSRQAASRAMDNLAHIPFNGRSILFSFENRTPLISNPPPQDPITESPQDYLIISGIDDDATAEEFEHDTFLNRYKEFYSDLRMQTNIKTKQKRIRVSFHSKDAIIEAECALLQCNFRGRKVDVKIEKIKQEETPPKQEYFTSSPVRPARPNRRSVTSNECIVIVMSIPPNTDNSDVARLFCPFGNIIRNIELKPMDQNPNLFQCKVVFDNPESAYWAVTEKDRLIYKGHILDVKLLSDLIQAETEPVQREVLWTDVKPMEPAPP